METARQTSGKQGTSLDFIVLVICLAITFFGWRYTQKIVDVQTKNNLLATADITEKSLIYGIDYYINALFAVKGLFSSSPEVTRDGFSSFFKGMDIKNRFPGVYSFVYVARVSDSDLPAFKKSMETDFAFNDMQGKVNFKLSGETEHYIINYAAYEHSETPVVYGLDLRTDPLRKQILEAARDSGNPTASPPLTIIGPNKPGFIITSPIYKKGEPLGTVEERRKALVGFINEAFLYDDFFASTLPLTGNMVNVHVTDGGTIIYESGVREKHGELASIKKDTVSLGDRDWKLEFYGYPNAGTNAVENNLPVVVLMIGILSSLLLFGITYALSSTTVRAQKLAQDMTVELKREKESVELKVAERTKELGEEKAKLVASIESLDAGLVFIDVGGNLLIKNRKVCEFAGKTGDKCSLDDVQVMLGTNFDIRKACNACVLTKGDIDVKDLLINSKYYDLRASPVFDNNAVIGSLVIIHDTTEARMLQRSRDEFFSIASHELRTPLTAIRGNTSLIQEMYADKIKDKDLADMIADIHNSSVRLINIVNDFLNISRLETGKMEYKKEPFDIVLLAKAVAKELGNPKEPVALLVTEPTGQIPTVLADKDRTKEILINLIGNGLKYTEKGTVSVSFSLINGSLKISVIDTGRGILPENQKLLFRKFQQAGSSLFTRDTTKSTGLGLYISKLMAEGMGGKVWLEATAPGKGSTFCFSLPIANTEININNKTNG